MVKMNNILFHCLIVITLSISPSFAYQSLSDLIKSNQIEKARQSAQVINLPNAPNITSFAGHLTINKTTESNLFFWYFPAQKSSGKTPLGVWLQGGPGAPSVFGLFTENGPLKVLPNMSVVIRDYSWTNFMSMVYIDQPVGTGFSYTNGDGYVNSEEEVGRDLFQFFIQFYQLFPEEKENDLYLTGESYAGKYVPAIAYKLHQERHSSGIRLKGLAIGDGYVDGGLQNIYADLLYQIGVFDEREANYGRKVEKQIEQLAKENKWRECFDLVDVYINGDRIRPTFFNNVTGCDNYENFLKTNNDDDPFDDYLAREDVRKAINVGNHTLSDGNKVLDHLMDDSCKSVKSWLEELIDADYEVLLYSGQLDIIVAPETTRRLIANMHWKNEQNYRNSPKKIWKIRHTNNVAGYIQSYNNFHFAIVRGAGHMVPADQPERAYDLIERFISGNI